MRSALIGVVLGTIIGCGSNPETRKTTRALVENNPETVGFPKADPPAQSDAESKQIAAKIVAAHTNNNPAILSKIKGVIFGRSGKHVSSESSFNGLAMNFSLSATWPNYGRYTWTGMSPTPFIIRVYEKQVARDIPNAAMQNPLPEKFYPDVQFHFYSDWLQLLVPLGEPESIFAPGPAFKLGDQTLPSIRIWMPDKPQAILYYDPKTFYVMRIAYEGRELGLPIHFELAMSDHRMLNGLLVAHHVYVRANGRDQIEYDKATLEFPKEHPLKLFTSP